jgi:AcrR family transcriptional regulator
MGASLTLEGDVLKLSDHSTPDHSGLSAATRVPTERSNRPRRQAKQDRSLATVDAILETSARVLVDQGYAAASSNRLAQVAGISIGALYECFANREDVSVIGALVHLLIRRYQKQP